MNPQSPRTPREEIEIRITAMLLGELLPDEAAALQTQIAADAELTALHARLRRAVGLLREASAIPEQAAPPEPVQLSAERRAKLLAHFKGGAPAPTPFIVTPKRDWKWAVPLGLAASLMALLGGAMFVNGFALRMNARSSLGMSADFHGGASERRLFRSSDELGLAAAGRRAVTHDYEFYPRHDGANQPADVKRLSDEAQSVVQAQIRRATVAKGAEWGSQPGMIRVYRQDGDGPAFEKLYSSRDIVASRPVIGEQLTSNYSVRFGNGTAVDARKMPALTSSTLADAPSTDAPANPGNSNEMEQRVDLDPYKPVLGTGVIDAITTTQASPFLLDRSGTSGVMAGTTVRESGVTKNGSGTLTITKNGGALPIAEPEGDRKAAAPSKSPPQFPVLNEPFGEKPAGRIALRTDDEAAKVKDNASGEPKKDNRVAQHQPTTEAPRANESLTFSDVVSGARDVTVTKSGAGTWQLGGAGNTYNGATIVNGGPLTFGNTGAAGVVSSNVTTKSGARAEVAVNRELNYQSEFKAPEIPQALGKDGAGTFAKAGDGTLVLGGTISNLTGTSQTTGTIYLGDTGNATPSSDMYFEESAHGQRGYVRDARKAVADPLMDQLGAQTIKRRALVEQLESQSQRIKGMAPEELTEALRTLNITEPTFEKMLPLFQDARAEEAKLLASGIGDNHPRLAAVREQKEQSRASLSDALDEIKANLGAKLEIEKKKLADLEAKLPEESVALKQEAAKAVEKLDEKKLEEPSEPEPATPKPAPTPLVPQPEVRTDSNAFSTFSLNVSDVAFKLAAASLERGAMPDVSTLRTEEFINAFEYRDPEPAAGAPLAFASERARYPFAQNRDLLRLSVKTAAAGRQLGKPLNIVLLLDNSGSMERADRVRIVREGLRTLSAQLQPQDRLSIVTFARTPHLWADGVAGDKAAEATARIGEITPEGGTNLAAALDLGYKTALRHYQVGSINHVVLLTDGAANLGDVDPAALKEKVEAHRRQGIALDCFGIGWEGLNDNLLEQLSRNGDGRYGFINTPEEAATNFAGQLAGALRVAASDVKVQVEFNPKRVTAYRQVGYAKHQLTKEQFRDNTVDAAELAAAESGNALYVVDVNPRGEGDLATVRVRFKVPGTSDYREHEWAVPFTRPAASLDESSSTLRLAGAAAAFAEMLAGSPYATEVTGDRLLQLVNGLPAIYGADARPKKLEWMIRQAKSLSGR